MKGILLGLVLFTSSVILLWYNEGRAVQTRKSLTEASSSFSEVNPNKISATNDGKLIFAQGKLKTSEVIKDTFTKVQSKALILKRKVLMYQYQEKESSVSDKDMNGKTSTRKSYSYHKVWQSRRIDSNKFAKSHFKNPFMFLKDKKVINSKVFLGAFKIPKKLLSKLANYKTLHTSTKIQNQLRVALKKKVTKIGEDSYFIGQSPSRPKVGDLKVKYQVIQPQSVSVLAKQARNSFAPYQTQAGDQLFIIKAGQLTASQLFKQEQQANKTMTWVLRFFGTLLLFFGVRTSFSFVSGMLSHVPLLGGILSMGVTIVAGVLSVSISLIVICLAWFAYRPLLSIVLLAIATSLVFTFSYLGKSKK